MADYPIRSERFIVREVHALRKLGVRIACDLYAESIDVAFDADHA